MTASADTSPRSLPDPLARLSSLALDMHWAWNHAGDAVWRRLDESLWERTQNPWLLLQHVPLERLERLAVDADFLRDLQAPGGLARSVQGLAAVAPGRRRPPPARGVLQHGVRPPRGVAAVRRRSGDPGGRLPEDRQRPRRPRRGHRHPLATGLLPAGARRSGTPDRTLPVQRAGKPACAAGAHTRRRTTPSVAELPGSHAPPARLARGRRPGHALPARQRRSVQ